MMKPTLTGCVFSSFSQAISYMYELGTPIGNWRSDHPTGTWGKNSFMRNEIFVSQIVIELLPFELTGNK